MKNNKECEIEVNDKEISSTRSNILISAGIFSEIKNDNGEDIMKMYFTTANGLYIGKMNLYSNEDFDKKLEDLLLAGEKIDSYLIVKKLAELNVEQNNLTLINEDDNIIGFNNVDFYPNYNENTKIHFGDIMIFKKEIISFGFFTNGDFFK